MPQMTVLTTDTRLCNLASGHNERWPFSQQTHNSSIVTLFPLSFVSLLCISMIFFSLPVWPAAQRQQVLFIR